MGYGELPIAVIPHPFGVLSREQVRVLADTCADEIAKLVCTSPSATSSSASVPATLAAEVEVSDDADAVNRLFRERRWSDGLPVVPPTRERVARMLKSAAATPDTVIASIAPGMGAATVELIAVNAVMAGCDPDYLPVLIAAVQAVTASAFNLQAIQSTTNPAAVWLIVSGPAAQRLAMNGGNNCLGQGNWANATLGRALRLILQNIGRALPGEMDLATQGQPGKFTFCCAENEAQSPWEPLHVEHGYSLQQSAVTVVGAEGTLNLNTHTKDADQLLRVFAESLPRPPSNDYRIGKGAPWLIIAPEHAAVLAAAGLTKMEVKRRLWEMSRMPAGRMADVDMRHMQQIRRPELGDIAADTQLTICRSPASLGIIVAGGPGTHSVYLPSFGDTVASTQEIFFAV